MSGRFTCVTCDELASKDFPLDALGQCEPCQQHHPVEMEPTQMLLCEDCPPRGYPTDETRCATCPRKALSDATGAE